MNTSPLLNSMHEAVWSALEDIRYRISDVRWGSVRDGKDRIAFIFDGEPCTAVLRGRNQDLVLTGDPDSDASVALRCILDGDMEIM